VLIFFEFFCKPDEIKGLQTFITFEIVIFLFFLHSLDFCFVLFLLSTIGLRKSKQSFVQTQYILKIMVR